MWRLKDDRHSNINFLSFYTAAPPSSRDATHGWAQGQRRDSIPFGKHSERHNTTVTEIPGQPAVKRTIKLAPPREAAIKVQVNGQKLLSADSYERRLRLRVDSELQPTLHKHFGREDLERGQLRYLPTFHIPNPSAHGPALIDRLELALDKTRERIEVEVLNKQALLVRPNIHKVDLDGLLYEGPYWTKVLWFI
ncbi:hypothetical protein B0H19DRAFT_1080853 [Mycena capillaripes]|nr:hypothetical protein B0H19DRAFT_1080853 [Mycena capillaripes]